MDRRYKHLNGEERGLILAEHRRGVSLRAIGSLPGRCASTIGRELLRGQGDDDGHYSPQAGRRVLDARRLRNRRPLQAGRGRRAPYPGAWQAVAFALVPGTDRGQAWSHASG
jgi:IS30 family transposase